MNYESAARVAAVWIPLFISGWLMHVARYCLSRWNMLALLALVAAGAAAYYGRAAWAMGLGTMYGACWVIAAVEGTRRR